MSEPTVFRNLIDKLIGGVEPPAPKGDTLPHFPPPLDENHRIRMGCPVLREDLIHRYREVISGVSPGGWTDDEFLDGFRFEWALADLCACRDCKASDGYACKLKLPEGKERIVGYVWRDCRSVAGGGYYMDLHRKKTCDAGKPVLRMFNCDGPDTRKAEIARRMVSYQ